MRTKKITVAIMCVALLAAFALAFAASAGDTSLSRIWSTSGWKTVGGSGTLDDPTLIFSGASINPGSITSNGTSFTARPLSGSLGLALADTTGSYEVYLDPSFTGATITDWTAAPEWKTRGFAHVYVKVTAADGDEQYYELYVGAGAAVVEISGLGIVWDGVQFRAGAATWAGAACGVLTVPTKNYVVEMADVITIGNQAGASTHDIVVMSAPTYSTGITRSSDGKYARVNNDDVLAIRVTNGTYSMYAKLTISAPPLSEGEDPEISSDASLVQVWRTEYFTTGTQAGTQDDPIVMTYAWLNNGSISATARAISSYFTAAAFSTAEYYSDADYTTEITSFETGTGWQENYAAEVYVKVTAEDGTTVKYYKCIIGAGTALRTIKGAAVELEQSYTAQPAAGTADTAKAGIVSFSTASTEVTPADIVALNPAATAVFTDGSASKTVGNGDTLELCVNFNNTVALMNDAPVANTIYYTITVSAPAASSAPTIANTAPAKRVAASGAEGMSDATVTSSISVADYNNFTILEIGTLIIKGETLAANGGGTVAYDIADVYKAIAQYLVDTDGASYTFRTAVLDIPDSEAGKTIEIVSYIKYQDQNGDTKYAYGPQSTYVIA